MNFLLDENVSLSLEAVILSCGHKVLSVARLPGRGRSDESVYQLAARSRAILITRDYHFTNPLRFPPGKTGGIIYIVHGNLNSTEEAKLVGDFLENYLPEHFKHRLTFLARHNVRFR